MSFEGKRVLALESRRATEIAELIRRQGGEPFVAPSMREVPIEQNAALMEFAERLSAGDFDMMILLTGVGTRQMNSALAEAYQETTFADAMRKLTVVARGPKPVAALRELGIKADIIVPEPNTWRELLQATAGLPERSIAVQEYGRSNEEFLQALRARGAEVTPVRIYRYGLPEDTGPLREAARRLAAGGFDVAMFTTAVQIEHLLRIAAEMGIEPAVRAGLSKCMVASIGPTTTESLEEFGVHPAMSPSHPKMGILVREAAERTNG
jgi:uroporphyrinogen-III synthase